MSTLDQLHVDADKEIAVIVDDILSNAPLPPDPFQSPEQIKQQARTILIDFLSAKDSRNRVAQGFKIIFRELSLHENPLLVNDIKAEWKKCAEELAQDMEARSSQAVSENETPTSLQEVFPVSDATIERFYQCGCRLHQDARYQEAADVFFVISTIDYRRHNAWLALGLAEKALASWEPALTAFSMAALTNIQDPLSFIHSAECYIALGEKVDAEDCIQAALELLSNQPAHETRKMTNYISFLKKSLS
jgi:tetratricopeptide (TPR) repeat protein